MNDQVPTVLPLHKITYLALGDSYTVGESVPLEHNFPYQLAENLRNSGLKVGIPQIIAKTGWITSELQTAIRSASLQQKFDLVTLLIGVNNQYRGEFPETYRKEFKELLATALNFAGGLKSRVFVVSIPDWGMTPFGKASGRELKEITEEINAFNSINKSETLAAGISYTDITPASRQAATDQSLVAIDGLHPSGKMYLEWALRVSPEVIKSFK